MKVKIYTTPFCPYCEMAKDLLRQQGLEFKEVDVQTDHKAAREMIKKSGQTGVPVIETDDKTIIGFNREEILKALGL